MSTFKTRCEDYAISAHRETNHMYDTYLPYEFHLRMVVKAANDFMYLVCDVHRRTVIDACWLHDTIEDCRKNYSDIATISNNDVAEIVRACTNYTRGRNRAERMPDFCYADIANTPYATFVKLCDRIANVQYSKMMGSTMYGKYKKEHGHFSKMLDSNNPELLPMWTYLDKLLAD